MQAASSSSSRVLEHIMLYMQNDYKARSCLSMFLAFTVELEGSAFRIYSPGFRFYCLGTVNLGLPTDSRLR